jgi:glycosyltransferase involved in cell wall biosynthesis
VVEARITVVVPSFNQGQFLDDALTSIFEQDVPMEVFVMDGGSSDGTLDVIRKWDGKLAGWRSNFDSGQADAINEGITKGTAPYVCWLNSDDWFLSGGLKTLLFELERQPHAPCVYGKVLNVSQKSGKKSSVRVEAFDEKRLALRCIISQPGTLIRRPAWEAVGGLDVKLQMAMDYDLWWHLFKQFGPLHFLNEFVAVNRVHKDTKTKTNRNLHYHEAIQVIRKYNGQVPLRWWLTQPYTVWFKSILARSGC